MKTCLVWLRYLLLVAMAARWMGCKTTAESENLSERPWNSPRGWEHGIPGFMNQGGR